MDNRTIADWLVDYAQHLEKRGESLYRVKAYRRAAESVLFSTWPVARILEEEGRRGLCRRLAGVGGHLSLTIEQLVKTGQLRPYDEWRAEGSCREKVQFGSVHEDNGAAEVRASNRLTQSN